MSVTQYTIPCRYNIPKLKDTVYFVSKSMAKIINIDNGTASVTINNPSPYPMSPSKLQGFNIRLNETESLDERYKFTKTLNISILGHLTDASFLMDDDYFLVVEDYEGNFYLINVDFPSKMTYAYTLNEAQNQTDFTFTSNSNHPLLKLNWEIAKWENCKVYNGYGIKNLKLIEKGWAKVDVEQDTITLFDNHTFKDVDFNKASCTLTENYDGSNITNTISFDIPFDNVQSSWQYNLLEFKQNLYIAEILPKNSEHALLVGYENGLQPSYNAQGGTSNGDASKITITLEETSQRGLEELINWSVVENTNKKWVYIKEIDHKNAFTCVGHGLARYDYMVETDQDGNELGNYKRFVDADASKFPYLNVVGTFDDEVTFQSSVCNCSDENVYKFNEHYYCINGDKVQALESIHTYDCGQTGTINGTGSPLSDYTEIGDVVEESSDFCEDEVEYMWVLKTDVSDCMVFQDRWVDSGYTCSGNSGYDKYLVQKQQIWDDEDGWIDTDPLVTAATLVEKNSEFCGYVPPPKYTYYTTDNPPHVITAECDSSSAITGFKLNYYIQRMEIGDCVTSIGDDAFYVCTALTSVSISDSVTSIGSRGFNLCVALKDVTMGEGVRSIGSLAFQNTSISHVYIPSGVTSNVNTNTFSISNTTSITVHNDNSVYDSRNNCNAAIHTSTNTIVLGCRNTVIPNTVTAIGNSAFYGCGALTALTIPNSVTAINDAAFVGCGFTSLGPVGSGAAIEIPLGLTTIGNQVFMGGGLTEVTIPNSVTSIGNSAFAGNEHLTALTIGDGVVTIGEDAFTSCYGLTSLTIGSSVTTIGNKAFQYCSGLTSVEIPSSVTSIGYFGFRSCNHLQSITCYATTPPVLGVYFHDISEVKVFDSTNNCPIYVPCESLYMYQSSSSWSKYADRIHPIGSCSLKYTLTFKDSSTKEKACDSTSALTKEELSAYSASVVSVSIGSCVETIGKQAFQAYSALTSVTMTDTITTIGKEAMSCGGLSSVTIPYSVTYIGRDAFYGSPWYRSYSADTANIYGNIVYINDIAYETVYGASSYQFKDNTVTIGDSAFAGRSITNMDIPNGVKNIGAYSFGNCRSLTSATIPSSVTFIGDQAFCDSVYLQSITCYATTPPELEIHTTSWGTSGYMNFSSTGNCPIYVPAASVDAYKAATGWNTYASRIQAIP